MSKYEVNRKFMHCPDFFAKMKESDQSKGMPQPPFCKEVAGELVTLPEFENILLEPSYEKLLDIRRSIRNYTEDPISQEQLAFLLWSVHGVQDYRGEKQDATLRPVPSGGARHPFEVYVAVRNVTGLRPGYYRYTPLENPCEKKVTLEYIKELQDDYKKEMKAMVAGQGWAANTAVVLFFSCIPYRGEWRYLDMSHRVMLIDVGHIGQNGMLSAAALGLGSCNIAAYNQELCDKALGFDGSDEFTAYILPVGVVK
jgi:SagB-type dehydrogenase family enzyme